MAGPLSMPTGASSLQAACTAPATWQDNIAHSLRALRYEVIQDGWTDLQETLWEINDPSEDGCSPGTNVTAGPGCDDTYCACPLSRLA